MNLREGTLYLHSFSPATAHNYTQSPGDPLRAGWPPRQWVGGQGIWGAGRKLPLGRGDWVAQTFNLGGDIGT